jgi:DNA-binding MarR family transcriptional regulator
MADIQTPKPVANDLDLEVAARIGWAWREIRRGTTASQARDAIYGIGGSAIEPGQMDALDLLVLVESCRMGDLAEHLRVDPSTATRAVQRLIKDDLAMKVKVDGDARAVHIAATERGRRIHGEVAERRRKIVMDIMTKYSPDEQSLLADFLERFTVAMEEATRPKPRRYHR